jgi:hypothetical protein
MHNDNTTQVGIMGAEMADKEIGASDSLFRAAVALDMAAQFAVIYGTDAAGTFVRAYVSARRAVDIELRELADARIALFQQRAAER